MLKQQTNTTQSRPFAVALGTSSGAVSPQYGIFG